jgi:flagellar biogenesis protein FliO
MNGVPTPKVGLGESRAPSAGVGLAGWVLGKLRGKLRGAPKAAPRLSIVERISLAPRQSLALIEAEGRRFLVATSQEGTPCLYPLGSETGNNANEAWRVL